MTELQYPDEFVARLHAVWGEGFLSPGGPKEVHEIVRGVDISGKHVLDIGSGTGGPAIVLARDFDAEVTGIDVEAQLVERATAAAARAGVSEHVEYRVVEPGPLPFDEARFDVVFSKDAMIHIPDKPALFAEVLRVLKPGGRFAASDWLIGAGARGTEALAEFTEAVHLEFELATAAETESAMNAAGFTGVATRDRNAWFTEVARDDLSLIEGPLRDELIAMIGPDSYGMMVRARRALVTAAEAGALRPTHLLGNRPTS